MSLFDAFKPKQTQISSIGESIMPVYPQEIYEAGMMEMQDIIAPTAFEINSNFVKIGEKFARTIFIYSYPRFISTGWFSPIINLDQIFNASIFVHPIDTDVVLKQMQKKVAEVQSQISMREEKGLVRDPILDTAQRDLEDLRDKLQQATEKLFSVGIYITVFGDTLEELNRSETEVTHILDSKLIHTKPALFQQLEGFDSVMPFCTDKLQVNSRLNSEPLSSVFPFVSFDLTSDRGILYGINRHNNSLILFDRFSLENYNSVIFAKSGSGKSYTTKLEILRSLMFGIDVIIIDPEREYEYLAEAVDGKYINISLTSKNHINPFDLPIPREDESPSDVLRSHIINLVGLFRIMFGGLSPEEDAVLDRAITETYAAHDITIDSDFSKVAPPILSDLELVLASTEGGGSIVQRLQKFTSGSWSGFLNQPTNIDMNKNFVSFSVRDMEDELKPVAIYLITHYIWGAIRQSIKKRLLIIDEAWWILKTEDGASFLFGLAKRARKYYLGVCTITQDVSDFLNSPYGKPLITNSSMQLLLRQSPAAIDSLQQVMSLTDEEKYLLLEAGVGEGMFFAGLKHAAIKVVASYTEDQIVSSDPAQIMAIKKAKAELKGTEK
jgi:type IV secretory pathway VirB4 component